MKKVKSGDNLQIPAATYNHFIDAAEDFRMRTRGLNSGKYEKIPQGQTVLIENNSGADVDECMPLGIDTSVFIPTTDLVKFSSNLLLSCIAPTEDHVGKFVITAQPIAAGQIGRAYAYGICVAKIAIASAEHDFADINDSGVLTSNVTGAARILYKAGTSGTQTCIVNLGTEAKDWFFGKITGGGGLWATVYTFAEQDYNGGHSFSDKADGRSGYAYEVNDVRGLYDPDGVPRYVQIFQSGGSYFFSAPLPPQEKNEYNQISGGPQVMVFTDGVLKWCDCKVVNMVEDYTVDPDNNLFKKRLRQLYVVDAGDQQNYQTDHQGDECLGDL